MKRSESPLTCHFVASDDLDGTLAGVTSVSPLSREAAATGHTLLALESMGDSGWLTGVTLLTGASLGSALSRWADIANFTLQSGREKK